ncbi:hypothetical protein [Haliangium sp.]|uniref:hypothetical protein n=1 Tax=Haliangium sp. TaxID=2663208 RepID=UPI003D118FBC
MPVNILTANQSNVTIDGTVIEGIQSISYRELRAQQDIMALGSEERVGVAYGAMSVQGSIVVASSSTTLNGHMAQKTSFQIVANLLKEFGTGQGSQTVTFDDCYVRDMAFGIDANGVGATTYEFTATRVQVE